MSNEPLSLYQLLSLLILLAGFAAVGGVLLLWYRLARQTARQTAQIADSLKVSLYGAGAIQMLTVDSLFLDHPGLRPYFYGGQDLREDDSLYPQALAMAELVLDYFNSIMRQMRHFPDVWPRVWWESYLIDSFKNSPVLCRYLRSVGDWYSADLNVLMKQGERKRQPPEAVAPSDVQATPA